MPDFRMRLAVLSAGLFALHGSVLAAQSAAPSLTLPRHVVECGSTLEAPTNYVECAYWLDGGRLRQGRQGEVVAKAGFFNPMPLERTLLGDSAHVYARAYERSTRRSYALGITGLVLEVAGFVVMTQYRCHPEPTFGLCTARDDDYLIPAGALVVAGTAFTFASIPFTVRARRQASQAVMWHNARFAR